MVKPQAASPCFGRIVWATIRNSKGEHPKYRPAVIITPTAELKEQCWVVSYWLAEIAVADIGDYAGKMSALQMVQILRKIP